MKTQIIDSRKLVKQIERVLAQRPASGKTAPLEQVIDLLYRQRSYSSIGIYAVSGQRILGLAYRGPALPCLEIALGKGPVGAGIQSGRTTVSQLQLQFEGAGSRLQAEIVVPIKLAGKVLGALDAESDRLTSFGYRDQVLLKQVAVLLARYLTSNGKSLMQKLRFRSLAAGRDAAGNQEKKAAPASERPATIGARKATAGEVLHA